MNTLMTIFLLLAYALTALPAACGAKAGADDSSIAEKARRERAEVPDTSGPSCPAIAPCSENHFERRCDSKEQPHHLEPFQAELLDLAWEIASEIPLEPHAKDRARVQHEVAQAYLELKQPEEALRCIQGIGNWRRGLAYAEYAFLLVQSQDSGEVDHYLGLAERIAGDAEDWRRDRIRVAIAQTHAWRGQEDRAAELEADVAESEAGKVEAVRASRMEAQRLDEQLATLERYARTGHLDLVRNSLSAAVELFDRFYESEEHRDRIEELVKPWFSTIPLMLQVEFEIELAQAALAHHDRPKALALIEEAEAVVKSDRISLEHQLPLKARLISLRDRAGDSGRASEAAGEALAIFDEQCERITSIYRAEAVRPIAEAYAVMGDRVKALSVYRRALEHGAVNPNARPRAEDLAETCISLAVNGVEPDTELWAHIRQIRAGLVAPW